MRHIVFHRGHSGRYYNVGAKGERQIIEDVVAELEQRLRSVGFDVRIYDGRDMPKVSCDLFIAPHCDSNASSDPQGFSVCMSKVQTGKLKQMSNDFRHTLTDIYAQETSIPNIQRCTINTDYYYAWRQVTGPKVLIEMGFVSNPKDLATLKTTELPANGIYKAILKYFNVEDEMVRPGKHFEKSWNWALKKKILSSHSRPRSSWTQQELIEILYRYNNLK